MTSLQRSFVLIFWSYSSETTCDAFKCGYECWPTLFQMCAGNNCDRTCTIYSHSENFMAEIRGRKDNSSSRMLPSLEGSRKENSPGELIEKIRKSESVSRKRPKTFPDRCGERKRLQHFQSAICNRDSQEQLQEIARIVHQNRIS